MTSNNERGLSIFIILISLAFLVVIILIAIVESENNIAQVTALVGTLTALVSVIWTQYNKKLEEENKFKLLEYDKKHQISKETYQKLFDEKISIYKSLYEELLKYKKRLADIGKQDYDMNSQGEMIFTEISTEEVNISTLRNILSIIEKNIFLISSKAEIIYNELSHSYRLKENEFQFMLEEIIGGEQEAIAESDKSDKKFFEAHQKSINELFNQIKIEIKQMKKEIGFI